MNAKQGQPNTHNRRGIGTRIGAAALVVTIAAWLLPNPLQADHAPQVATSGGTHGKPESVISTETMPMTRLDLTQSGAGYVFTFSGPVDGAHQGGKIFMEAVCPAQPAKRIDERRYRSLPATIDHNVWAVTWPTKVPLGKCSVEAVLER